MALKKPPTKKPPTMDPIPFNKDFDVPFEIRGNFSSSDVPQIMDDLKNIRMELERVGEVTKFTIIINKPTEIEIE